MFDDLQCFVPYLWASSVIDKKIPAGHSINLSPWLMEPECSMPHWQGLFNNPYPGPYQHISSYWYLFKIHSNILLPSMPRPFERYLSWAKMCRERSRISGQFVPGIGQQRPKTRPATVFAKHEIIDIFVITVSLNNEPRATWLPYLYRFCIHPFLCK